MHPSALIMLLACSFLKLNRENVNITTVIENCLRCLGIWCLCKSTGLKLYRKQNTVCLHGTEIFKVSEVKIRCQNCFRSGSVELRGRWCGEPAGSSWYLHCPGSTLLGSWTVPWSVVIQAAKKIRSFWKFFSWLQVLRCKWSKMKISKVQHRHCQAGFRRKFNTFTTISVSSITPQ